MIRGFFLWEDSILGNPPLSSLFSLNPVSSLFDNHRITRLAEICSWDRDGNWTSWTLLVFPEPLQPLKILLLSSFSSIAPVHRLHKDQWGWGCTGFYSAAHGFSALQSSHPSLWLSSFWTDIWDAFCLPKVNFLPTYSFTNVL